MRWLTVWVFAGLVTVREAAAHGTGLVGPDTLWRTWNADPLVLMPLLLALWIHTRGVRRVWSRADRGRSITRVRAFAFVLGVATLGVALVSPLDPLGETLLTAHMAQHALLVAIAPPLLLLGRPSVAFAWSLPLRWRRIVFRSAPWRFLARGFDTVARPLPAGVLHGLALWGWHAPTAFDAAVASHAIHALEHAAFFGTALLFWRAILDGWEGRRVGQALGLDLATLIHGGLLGALITLAPFPLYGWYADRTAIWGIDTLGDQQLAGILMWVPMSAVYLAAGLVLAGRFVNGSERRRRLSPTPSPPPIMRVTQ